MKKLISIVTPCYNEEENVKQVYEATQSIFNDLNQYNYEHIFIDNSSKDKTVKILKEIAQKDKNVKVIVNARNFGHIRSPYYAFLQAKGDAVISLVADLQDPPHLIKSFLDNWEKGHKVVLAVKSETEESFTMHWIRKAFYIFINRLSEVELTKDNTGFGLYDKQVVDVFRKLDDPYPYFRGLVADIGFEPFKIYYKQPNRRRGISKNNFYTLYDIAMLGITSHSKVPLRAATMMGFFMSAVGFLLALVFLIAKLLYWDQFSLGMAPVLIGIFLFSSLQLFFIGIIGEYIGAIHTQVLKRPLVIEKERINFS